MAIGGFRRLSREQWQQAREVHAVVIGAWLERGANVVAAGPFYDDEELRTVMSCVPPSTRPLRVLLDLPYAVTVERVRADATRDVSADESFLAGAYERFRQLRPSMPPQDYIWDAVVPVDDMAMEIVGRMLGDR